LVSLGFRKGKGKIAQSNKYKHGKREKPIGAKPTKTKRKRENATPENFARI
jgi:hypothetical protein